MNMNSTPDINDKFPETNIITDFLHFGAMKNFSGPVTTVDCFEDNSLVKRALSEKSHGGVLVVCGKKSKNVALMGDMIATMAHDNGWSGLIINGCVRDVEILNTINIGIMALGACPRKSKKENKGEIDKNIIINNINIEPQNWIYADLNGILVANTKLEI